MPKITPFLWYEHRAEEAAQFYVSVFRKNSKILSVSRCAEGGPMPKGSVMTVEFELEGQRFTALDAGPVHRFTPAISFVIDCADQEEVDYYWAKLTEGGEQSMCGWLTEARDGSDDDDEEDRHRRTGARGEGLTR